MTALTFGQYVTLVVTIVTTSCLSIIGSSLIMISILKRTETKRLEELKKDALSQFLLGLSASDILASMTLCTAPFMLPKGSYLQATTPWAIGNSTSCSTNAFMNVLFSTAGSFYNCFLSIHFWRTIRSSQKRGDRRNKQSTLSSSSWGGGCLLQATAHVVAFLIPSLLATAGVVTDTFHPNELIGVCYYRGDTSNCKTMDVYADDDDDRCFEEHALARKLSQLRVAVVAILAIASIGFTVSLTRKVQVSLQRSGRYEKRAAAAAAAAVATSATASFPNNTVSVTNDDKGNLSSTFLNTSLHSVPGVSVANNSALARAEKIETSAANKADNNSSGTPSSRQLPRSESFCRKENNTTTQATTSRRQLVQLQHGISSVRRRRKENDTNKQVATQALWYMVAYLNSFVVPVVVVIVANTTDAVNNPGKPNNFFLLWTLYFFQPLQGALNFCVYIRPRYNSWKTYLEKQRKQRQRQRQQQQQDDYSQELQSHMSDDTGFSQVEEVTANHDNNPLRPSFGIILKKAILENVPSPKQQQQQQQRQRHLYTSGDSNDRLCCPSAVSGVVDPMATIENGSLKEAGAVANDPTTLDC